MWRQGESVAAIARNLGVSRDTVYKYRDVEDFSAPVPKKRVYPSKLDPYKPLIDAWLDEDRKYSPKQRHTARRIHDRLVEEEGADVSVSLVERYVRTAKAARRRDEERYLDLVWEPGCAQADFGRSDFYVRGIRRPMSFFVLTFPFSNVGLSQVFSGENAECVCQGLKNIFEYIGGVPHRIIFDNAAGVGRRVKEAISTADLFSACAAHYGFSYRFCNPYAGHEKGCVENKVGAIRRNLFVPPAHIWNAEAFNEKLLDRCMGLSDKPHWIKDEVESQLFEQDKAALLGLARKPFSCVRYIARRADKFGKVRVDGKHFYSTSPELARKTLTIGLGAAAVEIYDESGVFICRHERAYGSSPTDSADPASQIGLLAYHAGAWKNSRVRESLPDMLRDHMDGLGKEDLKAKLRMMRDQCDASGWAATVRAMETVYKATGRLDAASVSLAIASERSKPIVYDDPVDLSVYDQALEAMR